MGTFANRPVSSGEVATLTADGAASANGPCRLIGVTINHTAATTAVLYDNASAASGTKVATISVPANGASQYWFGDEGILCQNGIYVDWNAGTVTVYYKYK